MRFEPSQCTQMYGPLLVEQALADAPVFGSDKANVPALIEKTLQSPSSETDIRVERPSLVDPSLSTPLRDRPIAERLRATRKSIVKHKTETETEVDGLANQLQASSVSEDGPTSCAQLHEDLLSVLPQAEQLTPEAQSDVDHVMLLRAKEKYLLDPVTNRNVVSDDLWLRYLWDWVAGEHS